MLVTMAMYESLRSTSPLPLPKTNVNVSTSLNSYITHPTRAGPEGPLAHMGTLPGRGYCWLACAISFDSITYHSYYQTGKGHCDCFTITILKKNSFTHYLHLPWPVDFLATCHHHHHHPPFFVCSSSS